MIDEAQKALEEAEALKKVFSFLWQILFCVLLHNFETLWKLIPTIESVCMCVLFFGLLVLICVIL